jgi:hypothetical protein
MNTAATFWLALLKAGRCPRTPLTVDHHGSFYLERGLAVMQFSQLVLNGYSLVGELTPSLCGPTLGVDL